MTDRQDDETRFRQTVRKYLAYRDDEELDDYIEARRFHSSRRRFRHENPMAVLMDQLRLLAVQDNPVTIEGRVGSGRFAIAQVLRDLSAVESANSVTLACPGADPSRLVELATAGCVLTLRDIDESGLAFQQALLGLLDETGGRPPKRVICTTARPLSELAAEGKLSGVLERRLARGARVLIPSLNDRRWDIPPIIVSAMGGIDPDETIESISYAAMHLLVHFNWTGEVAQLLEVLEGAVRQTQAAGGTILTLSSIGDQFKRVTSPEPPPSEPDPFGLEEARQGKYLAFLRATGSSELATFYLDQDRDSVYSDALTDREQVGNSWADFDAELWTGCYAVTWYPLSADALYDYIRRRKTSDVPENIAELPVIGDTPGTTDEAETAIRIVLRRERELFASLGPRVNRIGLDTSYGGNMFPSHSEVGEGTRLIKLNFTVDLGSLIASPDWLADDVWVLRDSWNVPLQTADQRILFTLSRLRDDLFDFLKAPAIKVVAAEPGSNPVAIPLAVGRAVGLVSDDRAGNYFRFEGAAWRVCFNGTVIQLPDLTGFQYIHLLLRSPNQPFEALQLRALIGDYPNTCSMNELPEFFERNDDETPDRKSGSQPRSRYPAGADAMLDADTIKNIEREYEKLTDDYQKAMESDHPDTAAKIDAEREKLTDYLRRATGLGGRVRQMSSDHSRAADSVRRAIDYAIRRIEPLHLELASHLRRSIEKGSRPRYSPVSPVDWIE